MGVVVKTWSTGISANVATGSRVSVVKRQSIIAPSMMSNAPTEELVEASLKRPLQSVNVLRVTKANFVRKISTSARPVLA